MGAGLLRFDFGGFAVGDAAFGVFILIVVVVVVLIVGEWVVLVVGDSWMAVTVVRGDLL